MSKQPNPLFKAFMRLFTRVETWRFRRSGGTTTFRGNQQLLLTTVGRKSGKERTTPLFYTRDGQDFVVIASYAGSDVHPAWWLNLKTAGEGWIEVGTERLKVVPAELDGEARERNWQTMAASYPDYNNYREKTDRHIPVIALQPA